MRCYLKQILCAVRNGAARLALALACDEPDGGEEVQATLAARKAGGGA